MREKATENLVQPGLCYQWIEVRRVKVLMTVIVVLVLKKKKKDKEENYYCSNQVKLTLATITSATDSTMWIAQRLTYKTKTN